MTSPVLPLPESLQKVLTDLLGRSVTAKKTPPGQVNPARPGVVATYVYDSGVTSALALCDLALASYAGGALMLLPPPAATDGVKAGKLDDTIVDNIREVLNICASLFISEDRAHVRLQAVYPLPGQTPPAVTKILGKPAARLDLEVHVAGYGVGRMALLTA